MHAFESALHMCPGGPFSEPAAIAAVPAQRRPLTHQQYVQGVLDGDRAMLARAITIVESARPADRELSERILDGCLPFIGRSLRIGITGVPGAGKSTLIEALGTFVTRERGEKIAVLAIDPSSSVSGGSILGDKTRMSTLASSEMVFIRPTPSRGAAGGVAQHTREAILLCEAAGYRNIVVETVGVGQTETAVHSMVDVFLLVLLSGAGDELQGIKRGVMELADLILINKADEENRAAAERTLAETRSVLHFFPGSGSGWTPRAMTCSAITGDHIPEIWSAILEHAAVTTASGWRDHHRRQQAKDWMRQSLDHALRQLLVSHPLLRDHLDACERDVIEGRTTPLRATRSLLEMYTHAPTGLSQGSHD